MLQIKRIYDDPAESDGFRVLVDKLWPRGVSKEQAAIDLWAKDIAPSTSLREWFDHKPAKFKEFSAKYTDELSSNPEVKELKSLLAEHSNATLLYAAKDPEVNHAVVLKKFLS